MSNHLHIQTLILKIYFAAHKFGSKLCVFIFTEKEATVIFRQPVQGADSAGRLLQIRWDWNRIPLWKLWSSYDHKSAPQTARTRNFRPNPQLLSLQASHYIQLFSHTIKKLVTQVRRAKASHAHTIPKLRGLLRSSHYQVHFHGSVLESGNHEWPKFKTHRF